MVEGAEDEFLLQKAAPLEGSTAQKDDNNDTTQQPFEMAPAGALSFENPLLMQALEVLEDQPEEGNDLVANEVIDRNVTEKREIGDASDSDATASDEEDIETKMQLSEDFTTFCGQAQERFAFTKLEHSDEIKPIHGDENMDKVLQFMTEILGYYSNKISAVHIEYLSCMVGVSSGEITRYISQQNMTKTKIKGIKRPRKVMSLTHNTKHVIDKKGKQGIAKKAKREKEKVDLATVESKYDKESFEDFCQSEMQRMEMQKLSVVTDLRNESDERVAKLKAFLKLVFDKFPEYELWMCKRLDELCGPNLHAIKNVLLTHYRKANKGSSPSWASSSKSVGRMANKPARLPYKPEKGLGCSKCRYGKNGCNTCGYYPEGTVFPAKMKKPAAPKPKKLKVLKIKLPKINKSKGTKKSRVVNKEATKRAKAAKHKKLLLEREKQEKQRMLDIESMENINQVPCARCIPYSKTLKNEIYNSIYHVSKMTIAKSRRNEAFFKDKDVPTDVSKKEQKKNIYSKRYQQSSRNHKEVQNNTLVKIGKSPVHAWGLFAAEDIKKDTRVIEYIGQLIRQPISDIRQYSYESQGMEDYLFRVGRQYVIDATLAGGPARYINHSCDPNCKPKQFMSENKIFIYSTKDIPKGTELSYDYMFELVQDMDKRIVCKCGAAKCSGYMNWKPPKICKQV